MRIALADVRWPLDPPRAATRDERLLVRTLYATPLRVDPRTNDVVAGLCTSWAARDGARTWRFRCARARAVRAALERARDAGSWMFAGAREISSRGDVVTVRFPFRWLRFPYALTSAAAAVRGAPGPFRIVSARAGRIVAARGARRIVFSEVAPRRAALLFRRGEVDEAPVALGDIRAALADPMLRGAVEVRQLSGIDAVVVDAARGSLAGLPNTRRVYWQTADRGDYQALVPEDEAGAAVSLVPGRSVDRAPARAFRAARSRIPSLPPIRVAVSSAAGLRYGTELLVASWRDLGLGARYAKGGRDATLVRVLADYPQDEALLGPFARGAFLGELGQQRGLDGADDALFSSSSVIPIAWVADARLVSPRLAGWREDGLGFVDYAKVRFRASIRRR